MRLAPDLPRVGPGGWAWTSTGLHVQRAPEAWQLQRGAGAEGSRQ